MFYLGEETMRQKRGARAAGPESAHRRPASGRKDALVAHGIAKSAPNSAPIILIPRGLIPAAFPRVDVQTTGAPSQLRGKPLVEVFKRVFSG